MRRGALKIEGFGIRSICVSLTVRVSRHSRGAVSMVSRCTCYELTYETPKGEPRQYWGSTEIRGSQTQADACQVRLRRHRRSPPSCLRGAVTRAMAIAPRGPVLVSENCLVQEAIFAASAIASDSSARGACFSCPQLGPKLRKTVQMILRATRNVEGQRARCAVIHLAASLGERHPLSKHLKGKCYKCGGKLGRCSCRLPPPVSGSGETPKKSRSGTSISGCAKRKRMGLASADPKYYKHQWGADVVKNRSADNKKQNAKRPDRARGHRSRLKF